MAGWGFLLLALAAADWAAVARCWWRADYILKPAVMLVLIAGLWLATRFAGAAAWFAAGLVFSLLGDIFLQLPERFFMGGLAAFLIAHLAYIAGFNPAGLPVRWESLLVTLAVLAAAAWLYRRLARALARRKSGPVLRGGVLVYSLALTAMLLSALLTLFRADWNTLPALLAAAGGLLFFASDCMLALNRFDAPIRNCKLLVRTTYHLGQLGLVAAVALQLAGK